MAFNQYTFMKLTHFNQETEQYIQETVTALKQLRFAQLLASTNSRFAPIGRSYPSISFRSLIGSTTGSWKMGWKKQPTGLGQMQIGTLRLDSLAVIGWGSMRFLELL